MKSKSPILYSTSILYMYKFLVSVFVICEIFILEISLVASYVCREYLIIVN